jgi:hypothetical protein
MLQITARGKSLAKQTVYGKKRGSLPKVMKAGTHGAEGKIARGDFSNVHIKPIGRKAGKVVLPRVSDVKAIDGGVRYLVVKRNPAVDKQMDKIRKTYGMAGYKVATTTSDGVVIVEPRSRPDSFGLKRLKQAVHKKPFPESL